MDVTRHDADLHFVRGDQARAVRAEQQGLLATLGFLFLHLVAHHQHVADGDAFGDADGQIEVGFDGFPDSGSSTSGRHVDDGNGSTGFSSGFLDGTVDGDVENLFASLLRVHASDEAFLAVCVFLALFGVELAGLAGDALGDDAGVLVDQNGHSGLLT
ncbi:hypothetical protein SDC9_160929 [bioreactor metagenome]|uniref:NAD-specific glutamate dehydrogenase n=1 Tax=bioreactor metagenome TaxID=1076179 RepID=A0A645FGZ6_9ZZZZ